MLLIIHALPTINVMERNYTVNHPFVTDNVMERTKVVMMNHPRVANNVVETTDAVTRLLVTDNVV